MSDILSQENDSLTAWQRWELPAFESARNTVRANLPTAVELEQMQQQAREEASQAGYAEGRQRGYADGLQQATQENQHLLELANVLAVKIDELVVQELTDLALDVARQVIQQAVKGMLPKNRLAARLLTKLKVYPGPEHPHAAQKPTPVTLSA